ncbi:hypothetical protein F4808DRAFT_466003 [Astrocystis sublimbata]|nr:hypothetical protein F4808DRAFT_466003 [Astrocystis sublimbata]
MLNVLDKNPDEIYDRLGDEDLRAYFTRDATFQTDPHTRVHMKLYTALSAFRFALKFSSKGHARSRYTFYRDARSMDTIIPGIRHPTYVNDYLYACSHEDRRESNSYLYLRGKEREEKMDLIELFKGPATETPILVLGGGPFTEMVRLLAETELAPLAIVAMARTWYADVNVFGNNYNDLMDLDVAMEIEELAKTRAIPTWFFPTECAKAKVKGDEVLRACPWDFTVEELIKIFETAGDMESYEQAAAFTSETMTLAKMHMFDVLMVVPLALPLSLPSRRAVSS